MARDIGPEKLVVINDARTSFLDAATNFVESYGVVFNEVIEGRSDLKIRLDYDDASRRGIPKPVTRFIDRVYGKKVSVESINIWWRYVPPSQGRDESYLNFIDIAVLNTAQASDLEKRSFSINHPKKEVAYSPIISLHPDLTPMGYRVGYSTTRELLASLDYPLSTRTLPGQFGPEVLLGIAKILKDHPKEKLSAKTAQELIRPDVKTTALINFIRMVRRQAPPAPSPHRSILVMD